MTATTTGAGFTDALGVVDGCDDPVGCTVEVVADGETVARGGGEAVHAAPTNNAAMRGIRFLTLIGAAYPTREAQILRARRPQRGAMTMFGIVLASHMKPPLRGIPGNAANRQNPSHITKGGHR